MAIAALFVGACSSPAPAGPAATSVSAAPPNVPAHAATSSAIKPSEPAAVPLAAGDPAPDVTFTLQDGSRVALSSLRGKQVLVYFYPKDDTPGCRIEAQGLRDHWDDVKKAGLLVFGVSRQDADSHIAFIDKEKLPFPLAVDTDGEIARAFHVPQRNGLASRQSFLVGADGKLSRVWLEVRPEEHAEAVLAAAAAP